MSLSELFEMQRVLDERIVKDKGLEGQDLLPMKILALQVELGECANEWRGFKFWSEDQSPRTQKWSRIEFKDNEFGGVDPVHGTDKYSNPLLEEYIDCLHFILSVGLISEFHEECEFNEQFWTKGVTITDSFSLVFGQIADFALDKDAWEYQCLVDKFLGLGDHLGFSWEQIEEAYKAKNAVNHERQANGY